MKLKIVIPLIALILLSFFSSAEDMVNEGNQQSYDYTSADSYQDPNFYSSCDYSSPDFNWDNADYSKIDYKRAEVYSSAGFDSKKVVAEKYLSDVGCSSCTLDNSGGFSLTYSRDGIKHANGDYVSIPGNYPSGVLFLSTDKGITVILPDEIAYADSSTPASSIRVSDKDSFTLKGENSELILPDGTKITVTGKLSFQDGQAYVKDKEAVIVNGVYIKPEYADVLICPGECKKPGLSNMQITMTKTTFEYKKTGEDGGLVTLFFKENNPYLKIEPTDYVKMTDVRNSPGTLKITNRDANGLIPLVEVNWKGPGLTITNGLIQIYVTKEVSSMFQMGQDISKTTSSPMSLKINPSLFGDKKILISNYNEFAIDDISTEKSPLIGARGKQISLNGNQLIPLYDGKYQLIGYSMGSSDSVFDQNGKKIGSIGPDLKVKYEQSALEAWTTTEHYDFAPGLVSERLYFNYQPYQTFYTDNIPIMAMSGSSRVPETDPTIVKRISDAIRILPPELRESVKGIVIGSDEEFEQDFARRKSNPNVALANVGAWTNPDGVIRLRASQLYENTIYHEASHDYTFRLLNDAKELKAQELYSLKQKYDKNNDGTIDDQAKYDAEKSALEDKYDIEIRTVGSARGFMSEFEYKWRLVHKDEYMANNKDVLSWKDGSTSANYGCSRAYGCTDFYEDVATYTENVYNNIDSLRELVTKSDERYIQKVSLLYEYGFISQDRYDIIMKDVSYSRRNLMLEAVRKLK